MKEETKSVAAALKSGGFEVKILVDQFSMHHIGCRMSLHVSKYPGASSRFLEQKY